MKYSLLRGVTLEEFRELKKQEPDLVKLIISQFTDHLEIKTTLLYNPSMSAVGIFVKNRNQQKSILGSQELNDREKTFVKNLYLNLEQRLYTLRLKK